MGVATIQGLSALDRPQTEGGLMARRNSKPNILFRVGVAKIQGSSALGHPQIESGLMAGRSSTPSSTREWLKFKGQEP